MFPFDNAVTSDDDLLVLAAYLQAEEAAAAARREAEIEEKDREQTAADSVEIQNTETQTQTAILTPDDTSGTAIKTPSTKRRQYTWVPRLREVDGVVRDKMAPIHGRLIAHGLLQFQLQGRDDGVVYRVTKAGHQAMTTATDDSQAA